MNPLLFWLGLFLALIFYAVPRILEGKQDASEPPRLPSKIPVIGHIIGMLRQKARYYVQLRQRHGAPIYSMAMPGGFKLYVITSTELIAAVQRRPKALSFPPVGVKFAMSLAGSSKGANKIATDNINGEDGDYGLSMDFNKVVYPALSPGKPLEAMYRIIVPQIAVSLDGLQREDTRPKTVRLTRWIRHEFTLAISDCVYGPGNPFKEKAVENAFWDFETDLFKIMMNIMPSVFARKGIQSRQVLIDAFQEYFERGALKSGSVFAQSRYASARKHNISMNDTARFEVVNLIGILTSTIRTVTWMLYHIYSSPVVLNDCREEIMRVVATSGEPDGERLLRTIDITAIKSNCPVLGSTFQEVLRHHALGTSVRQVMHDILLEKHYLLKKDSMILMPSTVVHSDPNYWGPTVNNFDHRRFLRPARPLSRGMKSGYQQKQQHKHPPPSAFRAFGGGTTLCPGRHFATTVTMAVTTMFLMRYEMRPVSNGGKWPHLTAYKTNAVAAVDQPDQEIDVEVMPRKGFETGNWAFRMEGSELMFATVAEDQV